MFMVQTENAEGFSYFRFFLQSLQLNKFIYYSPVKKIIFISLLILSIESAYSQSDSTQKKNLQLFNYQLEK